MTAFVRVFEYTAAPGREAEFEAAYGNAGDWVGLFATADGYVRSTLERRRDGRYRTQDLWRSAADFKRFLAAHQEEYDVIDRACAPLKLDEEHCGHFTELQPPGADWQPVADRQ